MRETGCALIVLAIGAICLGVGMRIGRAFSAASAMGVCALGLALAMWVFAILPGRVHEGPAGEPDITCGAC